MLKKIKKWFLRHAVELQRPFIAVYIITACLFLPLAVIATALNGGYLVLDATLFNEVYGEVVFAVCGVILFVKELPRILSKIL